MTIKALIFDFDGLIVDTELPDYQSWQETYESVGCSLPLAVWSATIGTDGVFDPYDELARQLGRPIDRAEIRARRRARFAELMQKQTVLPGVEQYIADAKARSMTIGVASSSSRSWVATYLKRFGLIHHFDCVKCADDVDLVKPDPALYVAALHSLGVQPHEAIAFEDSPNGVLAATRAGIYCVAVPNQLTRRLALEAANVRLASLAELRLDELLAHVGQRQAAHPTA
jgi:HAD superfamily hydrolase (TIGR01509 family)